MSYSIKNARCLVRVTGFVSLEGQRFDFDRVEWTNDTGNYVECLRRDKKDAILWDDEGQILYKKGVDELRRLIDLQNTSLIDYGLREVFIVRREDLQHFPFEVMMMLQTPITD